MNESKTPSHFQGKDAMSHVIEARQKGFAASSEIHGTELPGHYCAAADAAKETALILLILWLLSIPFDVCCFFLLGWVFWKSGRSAILGWSRLERLHRLIEEERWEIQHHRPQEKSELKALYAAKGFSGKLLDEVVDVLMSDDNRLLQVMLEEELGLNLGTHEHPLKQAAGALIGVTGAALIVSFGIYFLSSWTPLAPLFCAALVIALSAGTTAQLEKNKVMPAIVWNLAVASLAALVAFFASKAYLQS